ncbi:hypothetical protein [Bradyrhizobium sp. CCBAU 51753]|uniref:hypothetical protein n=1 Tax=Bradyrhizobium sp. CCBAU 51753 TaxID=1325100 RepID=UPI00188D15D9|nr:hypothetical protein [Bradyrhizobium sp. CCBAU 51753]QOZ25269.1 hypothetical protein XH93_17995 [Bradyrhizobium sp. CCBAU 51753]
MFVIKNVTTMPLPIDGVSVEPGEQLSVTTLSTDMVAAREAGKLQVKDAATTLEERKADVDGVKPFKVGDPAIDE